MMDGVFAPRCICVLLVFYAACNSPPGADAKSTQAKLAGSREGEPDVAAPRQLTGPPPTERVRYWIERKSTDSVLVLRLNGALIEDDRDRAWSYGSSWVTRWVHGGQNVLEVDVLASGEDGEPEGRVRVFKQFPESEREVDVAKASWPAPGAKLSLPATRKLAFEVNEDVPPCRLFAQAEVLRRGKQTEREVRAFVAALYAAIEGRKEKVLTEMMRYLVEDRERCSQQPPGKFSRTLASEVRDLLAYEQLVALDASSVELDYALGDRAIRVSRPGGGALLRLSGPERRRWSAPVFVGRIDGAWTWVR